MGDEKKLTLITNVEFVTVNGVRCHAHAVLIEPPMEPVSLIASAKVRGFGVDGAEPVFTLWLNSGDTAFTLTDAHDPSKIFIGDSGEARPLFRGAVLRVGGVEIALQVADYERPFEVEEFDSYQRVWDAVTERVASFWRAPAIPTLTWLPVETVRAVASVRHA